MKNIQQLIEILLLRISTFIQISNNAINSAQHTFRSPLPHFPEIKKKKHLYKHYTHSAGTKIDTKKRIRAFENSAQPHRSITKKFHKTDLFSGADIK